jgi:WD40 repeat protein
VWDPATGIELRTLSGHTDRVEAAVFSADGTRLASASDDGTVRVWDPATGSLVAELAVGAPVTALEWAADHRELALAAERHVIMLQVRHRR